MNLLQHAYCAAGPNRMSFQFPLDNLTDTLFDCLPPTLIPNLLTESQSIVLSQGPK